MISLNTAMTGSVAFMDAKFYDVIREKVKPEDKPGDVKKRICNKLREGRSDESI